MKRRKFITNTIGIPAVMLAPPYILFSNETLSIKPTKFQRVRPGEVGWPSAEAWERLTKAIDGKQIPLNSPFKECSLKGSDCSEVFQKLKNPYAIGDDPTLTQTLGWQNAWESEASVYAVAASSTRDVVAAVKFARANKLRLVIEGGGHSYQGTSNSKDSLLIWTKVTN